MLLPSSGLLRRADAVVVIGATLVAKAAGGGHRPITASLGRPAGGHGPWVAAPDLYPRRRRAGLSRKPRVLVKQRATWTGRAAAYQQAIDSGHPDQAPKASRNLGMLRACSREREISDK